MFSSAEGEKLKYSVKKTTQSKTNPGYFDAENGFKPTFWQASNGTTAISLLPTLYYCMDIKPLTD